MDQLTKRAVGSQEPSPKPQFRTFSNQDNQLYFVTEPCNASTLNRTYSRLELEQQPSRPSSAYSTPGSSRLNLQNTSLEDATIIRRQSSQRSNQKLCSTLPQQPQSSTSHTVEYSHFSQVERVCPPLPPKRYALRHTTSQPNIAQQTPPRPMASKPAIRPTSSTTYPHCYGLYQERVGNSRSSSRARSSEPRDYREENSYEVIQRSDGSERRHFPRPRSTTGVAYSQVNQLMGNAAGLSASSNEIFKLYQTRDCLGNVLYEFRPKSPLHYLDRSPIREAYDELDNCSSESTFTSRTDMSIPKINELEEDIPLASSEDSSFCTDHFSARFEQSGSKFNQQMEHSNPSNECLTKKAIEKGGNEKGLIHPESMEKELDFANLPTPKEGALSNSKDCSTVHIQPFQTLSISNHASRDMSNLPPSGRQSLKKKIAKTTTTERSNFVAIPPTKNLSEGSNDMLVEESSKVTSMQEDQQQIMEEMNKNYYLHPDSPIYLQELEYEPRRANSFSKKSKNEEEKVYSFRLVADDFKLKIIEEELEDF